MRELRGYGAPGAKVMERINPKMSSMRVMSDRYDCGRAVMDCGDVGG